MFELTGDLGFQMQMSAHVQNCVEVCDLGRRVLTPARMIHRLAHKVNYFSPNSQLQNCTRCQ